MRRVLLIVLVLVCLTGQASAAVPVIVQLRPLTNVAAEAALVRSVKTESAKAIISGTATNVDHLNPGYGGKLGSGRINVLAAVQ